MLRRLLSTNPDAGTVAARIALGAIMIPHGFQHGRSACSAAMASAAPSRG